MSKGVALPSLDGTDFHKRKEMMELTWHKKLSVGNAVIDSDHKNMMAAARGIERAILARHYEVIPQAFEFLEGWLCGHHANEEKLARAAGLDFSGHKKTQQASLAELRYLKAIMPDIGIMWSGDTLQRHVRLLKGWMSGHIHGDMPLKPSLQPLGYVFWPGEKAGEINHAAARAANLYLHLFDGETAPCAAC